MRLLSRTAFAAALLGSTFAASAFAAAPDTTGCPPGLHRAELEGGGVGSVNAATRKADLEGGGVGSVNAATRKAESEGGGVGSVNAATRKAESGRRRRWLGERGDPQGGLGRRRRWFGERSDPQGGSRSGVDGLHQVAYRRLAEVPNPAGGTSASRVRPL